MNIERRKTRKIRVGSLYIGGDAPVSVQSMTSLPIEDVAGTIGQIRRMAAEGADLVRLAVRNADSIGFLKQIRKAVDTPLSADIHFDHKLAIMAIESGIDKVRINPGNIGDPSGVRDIVKAARDHSVPIRIGSNSGSIDNKKYSAVTPEALVDSVMEHVGILEDNDFFDIIVSIKASDIFQTIEANRLFSRKKDYPLHIGLTEAGYGVSCIVQSSIAIGHLLLSGIGDTIRVSMTGDPVDEVIAGRKILESIGLKFAPLKIISCPTCGRTDPTVSILDIAKTVEKDLGEKFAERLHVLGKTLTVAVMGCEVNGPGEASHADVGVAGGRNGAFILFAGGEKIRRVDEKYVVKSLEEEADRLINFWSR
jgi:(E)-4-hydroxy-3-methylbut-2-enyl-diphosphate synthase